MPNPFFYPEGNAVEPKDNELRTLHKILASLGGGGGGTTTIIIRRGAPDTPGTVINQVWFNIDCFQWSYWDGAAWVLIDQAKGTGQYVRPTVVELRQIATVDCPPVMAWTYGNTTDFDGQGRRYGWNADSTDDDDGISVIKPDDVDASDPGRWLEIA